MMIRSLSRLFACLLLLVLGLQAPLPGAGDLQEAQADFDRANALYKESKFEEALEIYARLAGSPFATREVLTNAGDAAYQLRDMGRAVLYFKRALRLDPSHLVARENLARAVPAGGGPAEQTPLDALMNWFRGTSSLPWLVFAEITFAWLCLVIFQLIRVRDPERRAALLSMLAYATIVLIISVGTLAGHEIARTSAREAVVIPDKIIAKAGPGDKYVDILQLPAGTVVELTEDPQGGWVRFRLHDGRSGYVSTSAIEVI